MVLPKDKLISPNISNETKENKKQSNSNDMGGIKQPKNKSKLSLKYLKDIWHNKKQTPSFSDFSFLSSNKLSSDSTIHSKDGTSLDRDDSQDALKLLLLEENSQAIQEAELAHFLASNHKVSINTIDTSVLQNILEKLENTNELTDEHLELSDTNLKTEDIEQNFITDEELTQKLMPIHEEPEQPNDSETEVVQLRKELEASDATIKDLKQEVIDLIYSINSNDDAQIILSLKKEIFKRDHLIKESVDAGEILLEEIENTKKLLKEIGKEIRINWARLKNRRHTLVDLFHISRGCLSELTRQVISIHNETDSNVQKLREDCLKLRNDLGKEKFEAVTLKEKLDAQIKCYKAITEENCELKDMKRKYEVQIAKLNCEYSEKITTAFDKQEFFQNQFSQSMTDKANMFDELKVVQKENISLSSLNKMQDLKIKNLRNDLASIHESCSSVMNKLQQENETNLILTNKLELSVSRIEELERKCKEHEYSLADGEAWCMGMHHQDQAIVEELEVCLMEKEQLINTLKIQGDCGRNDVEKLQVEVNMRKAKMEELKKVLADFEKKREQVVKEQQEFYNKIKSLNITAALRENMCENLIRQCDKKSKIIKSLEEKLATAEKSIVEIKEEAWEKINELQSELKGAVERLREYESHVEVMDRDLERQISLMQNNLAEEKKHKTLAFEKIESYQNCIKEMKKDIEQMCSHVQRCEAQKKDLEKLVKRYQKEKSILEHTEEQVQTLKHKLVSLEAKEQNALMELEMKKQNLEQSFNKIATLENTLEETENCLTESQNVTQKIKAELAFSYEKIKTLTFDKQNLETQLNQIIKDKNFLQNDHEELCNKLISSVRMLMDAKIAHEKIETQVDNLKTIITHLNEEKKHSEAGMEYLKNTVSKTQKVVKMLEGEKHELCKEMEEYMTHPHEQYENCIKRLNKQLIDAKEESRKMCHQHTQEFLYLQAEKQQLEEFVEQMNGNQNIPETS